MLLREGVLFDGVFKDEMVLGGEESCNSIISVMILPDVMTAPLVMHNVFF